MLRVGLAGAGRAEQDDVLFAGEEVELAEVQDGVARDRGLEGEVELLERLARREARGLDAGLAAVAVAAVGLGLQQRRGELLIAPFLRAGAVGELGQRPRRGRRLELAEQVRELGRRGGSCDQRVVARQRPDLDRRLDVDAAGPERPRVREIGDRPVLGEAALVAAGELAGVQRDRQDLGRRDADLDAPADQRRGPASSRRCRSAGADRAGPAAPSADRCPAAWPAAAPSPRVPRAAGRPVGSAASCDDGRSRARRTRCRAAAGSRARSRTPGRARSCAR